MEPEELHEKAKYTATNHEQENRINFIRTLFSNMYKQIDENCKPGRETSLAMTKLEEAQFWAIKGITRE